MNQFKKEVEKIMMEINKTLPSPKTILYLDDEICNLLMLEVNFKRLSGYKVITAQSEEQALELLKTNHVDVFLTDYMMPMVNGNQMVEKVKNLYPQIKSMIITAYADGVKANVPVLNKPFNIPEIVNNINYIC